MLTLTLAYLFLLRLHPCDNRCSNFLSAFLNFYRVALNRLPYTFVPV